MAPRVTKHDLDPMLTVDEVAHILKLSPTTVRDYRAKGHPFFSGKGKLIGRSVRWLPADLQEYIENLPYTDAA